MQNLLMSRKFWAAVIGLLVIVVSAFLPSFGLDADQAAGYAIIIVAYIVGVAVDPGPGGWKGILQSRKFWAAVVGLIVMVLDSFHILLPLGLSPEQLILIAVTIGGYIAGVAVEQPLKLPVSTLDEHDIQSHG